MATERIMEWAVAKTDKRGKRTMLKYRFFFQPEAARYASMKNKLEKNNTYDIISVRGEPNER
jgi:hypothetical protein